MRTRDALEHATDELASAANRQLHVLEFQRRDGATRVVMQCTSLVQVEAQAFSFAVAFDITDYMRFQEALRDQDEKFRALFDNVADGMFFLRSDGSFLEVNPAACQQLGYSRTELLAMSVTQVSAREGFDVGRAMRNLGH